MKNYKINSFLLLLTLFTFSCVPKEDENCSKDKNNSTNAKCESDNTTPSEPPTSTPSEPAEPSTPNEPTTPNEQTIKESFFSPWNKSGTSIVIDAYEGNSIDWNKMATDTKVVGVIHRSSIGTRVDTQYKARKKIATERGYLWGAYHLGSRGNTIAQADLFLSLVEDDPETLMILDLEDTNASKLMTVEEAVIFMNRVYEKTGRIPVVYANHSVTNILNQKVKNNPLFQQSKLWYARFKSSIPDFPVGIWKNYFLWQFSSEINCSSTGSCLYNVPGTKFDMDVNVFYGSPTELQAQWHND
jgi:GH25 family lysozyme M1 (1,4-beta-N-acetylmuramidase)